MAREVRQEAAMTSLIIGGTRLVATAAGFLTRHQQELVAFIRGAGGPVDVLHDHRRVGITNSMTMNIVLGDALPAAARKGFVDVDAVLDTDRPPYYAPGGRPSFARMVGGAR